MLPSHRFADQIKPIRRAPENGGAMQFWTSWQFFLAALIVSAWATYGLIGVARQVEQARRLGSAPDRALTWRMVGHALFVGGPLLLALPCLFKTLAIDVGGAVVAAQIGFGLLDLVLGGFFLLGADRLANR
jgi:hypothetical protein